MIRLRGESNLPILAEVQSIMAQNLDRSQKLPLRLCSETLRLCTSVMSKFSFLAVLHTSSFVSSVVGSKEEETDDVVVPTHAVSTLETVLCRSSNEAHYLWSQFSRA
jgi:hypothetical protein